MTEERDPATFVSRCACLLLLYAPCWGAAAAADPSVTDRVLAERVLADPNLPRVLAAAEDLLRSGFNAGSGYREVWIRDLNTFIELALRVHDPRPVRDALLTFGRFQGGDGDIVDGYVPAEQARAGYRYRQSALAPALRAHKNTVETDQESSWVQAVRKYVTITGDRRLLDASVGALSVRQRLERALDYVLRQRFEPRYGLVWGATTVDWGDVQPEHAWGVELDSHSHRALDIYDNAMFLIAVQDYLDLLPPGARGRARWQRVQATVRASVRRVLWDEARGGFRPHVYLSGSPFPSFDESGVCYHGGSAVAVEAGLLSPDEVTRVLARMRRDVRQAGAATIGLTLYPVYPAGSFKNPAMTPYGYQNGGDWSWFGGRWVRQLLRLGRAADAYRELQPMTDRVLRHGGFYEWWSRDNQPRGSQRFRGSAGVLGMAIVELRAWAEQETGASGGSAVP